MVNRNRNYVLFTFFICFIACRADVKLGKDSANVDETLNRPQLQSTVNRSTISTEASKPSESVHIDSLPSDKVQDIPPITVPVIPVTPKPDPDPTTPLTPITFSPVPPITTEKPPVPTTPTTTPIPPTTSTKAPITTTSTLKPTTNATDPTTVKPSSVTTAIPKTTATPSAPTAAPSHHSRQFDGASFIGGIVLASGLMAIGFVAFKFYKARTERNYHTL